MVCIDHILLLGVPGGLCKKIGQRDGVYGDYGRVFHLSSHLESAPILPHESKPNRQISAGRWIQLYLGNHVVVPSAFDNL